MNLKPRILDHAHPKSIASLCIINRSIYVLNLISERFDMLS